MEQIPYILAIESSCDDTSAAVLYGNKVLSNEVASQEVHTAYGGVVPELASRAHQQNIVPVVDRALKVANIKPSQLHAIAFTNGPGLMGSLLVGTSFAKSLALALDIPLQSHEHHRPPSAARANLPPTGRGSRRLPAASQRQAAPAAPTCCPPRWRSPRTARSPRTWARR